MGEVLFPQKFRSGNPLKERVISKEVAIQVYAALMNIYGALNMSMSGNFKLAQFISQNPKGLDEKDTLAAISMATNNGMMMENLRNAVHTVMTALVADSESTLPKSTLPKMFQDNFKQNESAKPPDDQPPAA